MSRLGIVIVLCLRVNLDGWFHRKDLPELSSIQLGWSALTFKDVDSSSLIMKSVCYEVE